MTPCQGNAALYDIVLFDDAPTDERQQATHRAAALCATCPTPCAQKVTVDSGPVELVLLDADWLPPSREGRARPQPRRQAKPAVSPRIAAWAQMAAERAALGHSVAAIAVDLCVTEDTAQQLIGLGQSARAA